MKRFLGCLAVGGFTALLAGGIGGYFLYVKTIEWGREGAAAGIEMIVEEIAKENLAKEEVEAVMDPVRELTKKIRVGEVGIEAAINVSQELSRSPVVPALVSIAFSRAYIEKSELPDDQKAAAKMTVSRFTRGVVDGRIEKARAEPVYALIQETAPDGHSKRLKNNLTPEELEKSLELMKSSADDAGVEETVIQIDISEEIRSAIQKGLSRPLGDEEQAESGE